MVKFFSEPGSPGPYLRPDMLYMHFCAVLMDIQAKEHIGQLYLYSNDVF